MMTFLRRQSQTVLIIILGVLGLSFLFYGNVGSLLTNGSGRGGGNDYGRIDGEDVSVAELYGAVRNARYALLLQGHAQDLNAAGARKELAEEGWRQLLLQHEAERLHLEISDQELVDFIKSRPAFQKNGRLRSRDLPDGVDQPGNQSPHHPRRLRVAYPQQPPG